jgi:Flp pilus assembly protein TadB
MGFFQSSQSELQSKLHEESIYEAVATEISGGNIKPGLYAKALAGADGDEKIAKAKYITLRVEMIKAELAATAEVFSEISAKEKREERAREKQAKEQVKLPQQRYEAHTQTQQWETSERDRISRLKKQEEERKWVQQRREEDQNRLQKWQARQDAKAQNIPKDWSFPWSIAAFICFLLFTLSISLFWFVTMCVCIGMAIGTHQPPPQ